MPKITQEKPTPPEPSNGRATGVLKPGKNPVVGPSSRPALVSAQLTAEESDLWGSEAVRVLVYGQSGTGKTRFWATFPGRTLAVICSGGARPGELRSIRTPENMKRIRPKLVSSTDQLTALLEEARGYDNVVLDHASGLQDLVLKEILGLPEIPVQRPVIGDNKRTWGEVALRGKEWFRAFLNLPGNVVIVAQERTFGGDDETGGEVVRPTVGAALTPSLSGWLAPACDYVVETFKRAQVAEQEVTLDDGSAGGKVQVRTGKFEFCMRTGVSDIYQTKFRVVHNNLPDVIVNPDYNKFMAVVRGIYKP